MQGETKKKDSRSLRYKYNENYFDELGPNQAYIIGYAMADSCNDREKSIRFNCKDKEILEFVQREICPSKPIKDDIRGDKTYYLLVVNNRRIVSTLTSLGIVPRKTGKEKVPKEITKGLFPHFLRGYPIDRDWETTSR